MRCTTVRQSLASWVSVPHKNSKWYDSWPKISFLVLQRMFVIVIVFLRKHLSILFRNGVTSIITCQNLERHFGFFKQSLGLMFLRKVNNSPSLSAIVCVWCVKLCDTLRDLSIDLLYLTWKGAQWTVRLVTEESYCSLYFRGRREDTCVTEQENRQKGSARPPVRTSWATVVAVTASSSSTSSRRDCD